jgi:hypothetical protein
MANVLQHISRHGRNGFRVNVLRVDMVGPQMTSNCLCSHNKYGRDYFLKSQERGGSSVALKRRRLSRRRAGDIFVIGLGRAIVSRFGASIDPLVNQICRQSISSLLGGNSAS